MREITLDTGALISLERQRQRMTDVFRYALASGRRVTVPTVVVGEWWRAKTFARLGLLEAVNIEPLSLDLARRAGEAMAAVRGATLVDAVVMASAASRGDAVYTSDPDDLEALRAFFPGVLVLGV